jgi:hypothetical protein
MFLVLHVYLASDTSKNGVHVFVEFSFQINSWLGAISLLKLCTELPATLFLETSIVKDLCSVLVFAGPLFFCVRSPT